MQQKSSLMLRRVCAAGGGAVVTLLGLTSQRAHAQTYRVVSLVPTGASYATDISSDGKVCGTKSVGSPGFVWMHDGDGTNTVVELTKVPRSFSPSGNLIATDTGALILFFGKVLDGSTAGLASNLPASFRAYSINDDGIIVGTASTTKGVYGYFRNLHKPTTSWLGDGYYGAGNNTSSGSAVLAPFASSLATAINRQGKVGGYGVNKATNKEQPFIDSYTAGRPQPESGYATLASQENGAIFDINETGWGGGYAIAFSDPSCQFPALVNNGPHEFKFLGASTLQLTPNRKGCVVGLNDSNEGVGWSNKVGDSSGNKYPCLFVQSSGSTKDLNALLEPQKVIATIMGKQMVFYLPSDWHVMGAVDINNAGDIAATAYYGSDTTPHAVLLKRL